MTSWWHAPNPSFYTTMNSIHAVKPLGQGQVLLVQPALSLLYMYSSVENNNNNYYGTCRVNRCGLQWKSSNTDTLGPLKCACPDQRGVLISGTWSSVQAA